MWTEFRYRVMRMLRRLANLPEGCVAPKWLVVCYYILFPLNWLYERNSGIRYDAPTDVYIIQGTKITGEFFRHLNQSVGQKFEIDQNKDGLIILRTIRPYEFFIDKVCKN